MAKYIDGDALYVEVTERYRDIKAGSYPYNIVAYDMARLVENAPTVDAEPVRHGRWKKMGEADYKCSVCGFRFTTADHIEMFPYCRCGAKMDEVQ